MVVVALLLIALAVFLFFAQAKRTKKVSRGRTTQNVFSYSSCEGLIPCFDFHIFSQRKVRHESLTDLFSC